MMSTNTMSGLMVGDLRQRIEAIDRREIPRNPSFDSSVSAERPDGLAVVDDQQLSRPVNRAD